MPALTRSLQDQRDFVWDWSIYGWPGEPPTSLHAPNIPSISPNPCGLADFHRDVCAHEKAPVKGKKAVSGIEGRIVYGSVRRVPPLLCSWARSAKRRGSGAQGMGDGEQDGRDCMRLGEGTFTGAHVAPRVTGHRSPIAGATVSCMFSADEGPEPRPSTVARSQNVPNAEPVSLPPPSWLPPLHRPPQTLRRPNWLCTI